MSLAKLLTEQQAWLRLAKAWKNANRVLGSYVVSSTAVHGGEDTAWAQGLCYCVDLLLLAHANYTDVKYSVSISTYAVMHRKIRTHGDKLERGGYLWDTDTRRGQKQRVAFCLRQAKLCEKEERSADALRLKAKRKNH